MDHQVGLAGGGHHHCHDEEHPHLGDGHHEPVLLLEVGVHLEEVEVSPALEEDAGGHDGDEVQGQEQEEVGHRGLQALSRLVWCRHFTVKLTKIVFPTSSCAVVTSSVS